MNNRLLVILIQKNLFYHDVAICTSFILIAHQAESFVTFFTYFSKHNT